MAKNDWSIKWECKWSKDKMMKQARQSKTHQMRKQNPVKNMMARRECIGVVHNCRDSKLVHTKNTIKTMSMTHEKWNMS